MNGNNQEQAIIIAERGQIATQSSPLDALAFMSETEFEHRLESLKVAQRRMQRIQRELMEAGTDYGVIPGTGDKPTLLKPGTEKLCKFHRLVPTFVIEMVMGDGLNRPHIRVLATCNLHYESEQGPVVAQGMGAANSWEKKYRWRDGQRKCPHCGAAAIIKGQEKYGGGYLCWQKRGGCGAKFGDADAAITTQQTGQVENPDPFDTENTLRKMAAKRAQTDATLRATATSGLFSQDLEDIADGTPPPETLVMPSATPAQPAVAKKAAQKAGATIPSAEETKDLRHFLQWAYRVSRLPQDELLPILGVENALQITDFHAAAKVLLANIPLDTAKEPVHEAPQGGAEVTD